MPIGKIDWSSFTDALTALLPPTIALVSLTLGALLTITLVFKGAQLVMWWLYKAIAGSSTNSPDDGIPF